MNILLFPGSFSPYTDGHYGIVSRYISASKEQDMNIDKVVIIISSKVREGIDTKSVFAFVKQLYSNDKRFEIILSGDKGPVREAYKYVNVHASEGEDNTYIFVRSSKDDDSIADDFNKRFGKGGESELDNVHIGNIDVSDSPIVYKNRKDKYNGKPISASVVREDLRHKDFNMFKTSYEMILRSEITITEKHLQRVFDIWSKDVTEKTDDSKQKLSESVTRNIGKATVTDAIEKADTSIIDFTPEYIFNRLKSEYFDPLGYEEGDVDCAEGDYYFDRERNILDFGLMLSDRERTEQQFKFQVKFTQEGFSYKDGYKKVITLYDEKKWMFSLAFNVDKDTADMRFKLEKVPVVKNIDGLFYYNMNVNSVKTFFNIIKNIGLDHTNDDLDEHISDTFEQKIEFSIFDFESLEPYMEDFNRMYDFKYAYKWALNKIVEREREFSEEFGDMY